MPTFPVTISVYERRGLKQGPGILDARFRKLPSGLPILTTGGGPLGEPTYQFEIDFLVASVRIDSPRHYSVDLTVEATGVDEVWLDRR
jgi:hypothetical protein